jgi:hypothetical protein
LSQSLYKLVDALEEALLSVVDPETGEIVGDEQAVEAVEMDLRAKALGVAAYCKGLVFEAERTEAVGAAIRKQADSHAERGKKLRSQATYWMAYLDAQLDRAEIKPLPKQTMAKLGDERVEIVYAKSQRVIVDAETGMIPDEFMREKTTRSPDLKALGDACKLRKDHALVIDGAKVAHIEHRQALKVK